MISRSFGLALVLFLFGPLASAAHACGEPVVDLLKTLPTMKAAPEMRCGSDFNLMLALAYKKDWIGALNAYKAHLAGLGRPEAGTPDSNMTLAYLEQMASTDTKSK